MTYQEYYDIFKRRHQGKSIVELGFAMNDCHGTLKFHNDKPPSDPYCVKLWAEIDACRDIFLSRNKPSKVKA